MKNQVTTSGILTHLVVMSQRSKLSQPDVSHGLLPRIIWKVIPGKQTVCRFPYVTD